MKFINGITLHK